MSLAERGGRGPRFAAIDAVRGAAIAAMVVYHFSWDLSAFGLIGVDVIADPGWKAFARTIAGTFVTLVGVSLVLATRNGLQLRPFLRRFALIAGAALLVSVGTWFQFPDAFVFFGILHLIAFASVAALPFLRLPSPVVLLAAIAIFVLPFVYRSEIFNHPLLWWVGFTPRPPSTVDYVPVFPWFALTLFGIVLGRLFLKFASAGAFAHWTPQGWLGRLAVLAGRWSLPIYLVHQPLLIGALNLAMLLFPGLSTSDAAIFGDQCVSTCQAGGNQPAGCEDYCGCVLSGLEGEGLLASAVRGQLDEAGTDRWRTFVEACRPDPSAFDPSG